MWEMLLLLQMLVTKRVCYELNGETGKIDFVGKEKMAQLLEKHPEWKSAYLTKTVRKRSIPSSICKRCVASSRKNK
ncbi:MAG: DUF6563 family protein [Bacteroides thetaiotaomicron]